MKDKFLAGYITGILVLTFVAVIDSKWYITVLISLVGYRVGRVLGDKLWGGDKK